MQQLTKVSDITAQDLADYLHISGTLTTDETNELNSYLNIAKTFVQQYTGRTSTEIDEYPDITEVVLILVQDMYDNRTMYVDSKNLNHVYESILSLHAVNLL